MSTKANRQFLSEHPVFSRLADSDLDFLAENSQTLSLEPGEWLFREGGAADSFFIILQGQVGLLTNAAHGHPLVVQSLDTREIVGLSWIVPPYTWGFDARVCQSTMVMQVDARALRARCETDPAFGFATMRKVSELMLERLQAVRSHMAERIHELEGKVQ